MREGASEDRLPLITVFVDTNCFIHLRDLTDLPWSTEFPDAQRIEIAVAPIVVDELDELKVSREGRLRDRARAALKTIETASAQPHQALHLRSDPVELSLRLTSGLGKELGVPSELDIGRPDDLLVAIVWAEKVEGRKELLSFDTGPLIRARRIGLQARKAPMAWLLPDQADAASQKIARLERELESLRANRPQIRASFLHRGEPVDRLVFFVPKLPPLPALVQEELIAEAVRRNPMVFGAYAIPLPGLAHFSHDDISNYVQEHSKFGPNVRRYFSRLHELIRLAHSAPDIEYEVTNASSTTAESIIVRIIAGGEAKISAIGNGLVRGIRVLATPKPPPIPRTRDQIEALEYSISMHQTARRREATAFYWKSRPSGQDSSGSLECEEFRPAAMKRDAFSFILPERHTLPYHGEVSLNIDARNTSAPVSLKAMITISEIEANWSDPEVHIGLDKWIVDWLNAD